MRCTATDTTKVANTSATAASTGADLNGKAAEDAARQIRQRLAAFFASRHGVDAAEVRFANGRAGAGAVSESFDDLALAAYEARVQLWSDGFYATPGLSWDRETMTGRPFYYFAYGAAVSEVLVDTLTGEHKLLAAHVLHDVGRSLNPAIDVGQVEGAFIQGMGWLTSEELWWHPRSGRLMTHLHEIEQSAQYRLNSLMHTLPKQSGVTEDMKAENPMRWAAQMNSLKHQAEEMILSELIYS